MDREPGEVGVLAGEHDFLHRRLGAADLHQFLRRGEPFQHQRQEGLRRTLEAGGDARAAAGHPAHQLGALGAGIGEQHRARVPVEHGGDVDQVDRVRVHLRLAGLDEALDEGAKAEPFQIGCGCGHGVRCY